LSGRDAYTVIKESGTTMLKSRITRLIPLVLLGGALLALSSCSSDKGTGEYEIFGNGFKDVSPVIAKVGDITITRFDFDTRYKELPTNVKRRFSGDNWEDRFLRFMVDEALVYQSAVDAQIDKDPEIAQSFISYRRYIMNDGFKRLVLWEDLTPNQEDIQSYYDDNPEDFVAAGMVRARHVECDTEAEIRAAWDALHGEGRDALFAYVVGKYTENEESKKLSGDLGWFNRNGYIGAIYAHKEFIEAVWDLPIGLNPPIKVADKWHIVEIQNRKPSRPLSMAEARPQIIEKLKPMVQQQKLESLLVAKREEVPIKYFGDFEPGSGCTAEELFNRALAAGDPLVQLELYQILINDYPENEYKPKALFMCANIQLDRWQDRNSASKLLMQLIEDYPESDLVDQADFMLKNMSSRELVSPQSIEDLQKLAD